MQIHSALVTERTEFTHIKVTQKSGGTPVRNIWIMMDPKRYSSWLLIVNVEDTIYFGCIRCTEIKIEKITIRQALGHDFEPKCADLNYSHLGLEKRGKNCRRCSRTTACESKRWHEINIFFLYCTLTHRSTKAEAALNIKQLTREAVITPSAIWMEELLV